MGSDQSRISREREFVRLEREREDLRRAREEQLQEALRLEKEKNLYRRAREDLAVKAFESQQLQEALRRSNAETQSQLYPSLNPIAGSSRNETYQTTVAPNLVVNNDHLRFQPSVPSAPLAPTVCQPSETRAPPPRPRPPTAHNIKPVTETSAAARVPQATNIPAVAAASNDKKIFPRNDDNKRCQTCRKPYEDKIFQCENGHSGCEACKSSNLCCRLCVGVVKFTNTRNFDLENYITANQTVKCPNAADGCILSFKKSELTKHEKECPFKELKCPALGYCNWRGKLSQISIHFDEEHPSSRQANVDTEMFLPDIRSEYNSLQLIKLGTYNFLFYVKVSEIEPKVYMDVQLIGTKISASKWYYEIHVYNKREPRRKYQYIDSCRSSNETPGISLYNCAVLPLPYAMTFVNEGNLTYKLFIKKNLNQKQN